MSKTVTLKLLSAIAIAGNVVPAGETVEVDGVLAQNLIARGKAEDPSNPQNAAQASASVPVPESGKHDHEGGTVTTDQDARARAMKDNGLTVAQYEKLTEAKREAILKAARDAIATEAA